MLALLGGTVLALAQAAPGERKSIDTSPPAAGGNAVIRARAGRSDIVITTTTRLAGAIHSLRWDGKELVDSADHGRQIQSAANFDCGRPFVPETFNPTEAGSRDDGAGEKSSSKLLKLEARGAELRSTTQMAFWLAPGEKSDGHPALNQRILSDHLLTKRVHIGHKDLAHAIEYDVTFTVPRGEKHHFAQFEAVTGYMPEEFGVFWKYSPHARKLDRLEAGQGEQRDPVVLATRSGAYAMGVYSPDQPSPGFEQAGYGRFHFREQHVTKWNCVFRIRSPRGLEAGDYRYRMFVLVGTLADVEKTMTALHAEYQKR